MAHRTDPRSPPCWPPTSGSQLPSPPCGRSSPSPAFITAALAIPAPRRYLKRHAWCLISRHRLQRVCYEGRLHTRAGRLPLILWIRPTKVGERAHILCRAGICADDFDAYKAEIGAGCYAREARVIRNKKWSHFVTIDIIRHDPLDRRRHHPLAHSPPDRHPAMTSHPVPDHPARHQGREPVS